jgi:Zn-dependent protease
MLRYLLTGGGDPKEYILHLLLCIPIIFLSLSLHETAHGYVASKLGDPTAKSLGRLTLNPIKHLDPIGFICMLLMGFGWAKPVPINTRYFKKPRRDMALSAIAGPISNILLAVIFAIALRLFYFVLPYIIPSAPTEMLLNVLSYTRVFLYYGITLNISLAVFNLLPVPPLDGSRFFYVFLPPKYYFGVMKYENYISIAVMVLLFVGVLDPVLSFARNGIMDLIFAPLGLGAFIY